MRNFDQVTSKPYRVYNSSNSKEFFKSKFCPHLYLRGCLPLEKQKVLCGLSSAFGMLFGNRKHIFSSSVTGAESAWMWMQPQVFVSLVCVSLQGPSCWEP